ncbi:hypothetical protein DYBT9275_03956 [Dyadobacter sp. CECT 9275]|uniref:PorZ N-terminal beta-propeller domain-containing protein n=1 Tax=Dyadobacter helix TaxID=2822344 RepID=A0A916JEE7_9BACT|nr:T9SS type A sorting domain-containing protein [Dyadobacter sp. CECT 9275]CAG5007063.1 hypothetical protein DYBT9275_03956 [Dyadobacter sp. CECT 9275]
MRAGKIILLVVVSQLCLAQGIPVDDWQTHFSYKSAREICITQKKIFCSSYNGLFSTDLKGDQYRLISKSDGLHDTGISSMAYNEAGNLVLLAYRSGQLDILFLDKDNEIEGVEAWPVLMQASGLPAEKKINQIVFKNNLTYLSTNFGIVVLDLPLRQVKESYRYIGTAGIEIAVSGITFSSDSLYACSSQGLLVSSLSPSVNRQYFANWHTVNTPDRPVAIGFYKNQLYAGFKNKGIASFQSGSWKEVYQSSSTSYSFSTDQDRLICSTDRQLVTISDQISVFNSSLFNQMSRAGQSATGNLWVADQQAGLLGNVNNEFEIFSPPTGDTTIVNRADSVITDLNGNTWTRLPVYLGGGIQVKAPGGNQQRILSTATGAGTLPSSKINSLALDKDGLVWFASDRGAGYLIADNILNASRVDAVLPIYGQRKLLSNEICTSVISDPGNRKWIGTKSGLYLFNPDGTELIRPFRAADSPLPANEIKALSFEGSTGILFIETTSGMVSYRTGAGNPSADLAQVTIFPNPVRPGYSGQVGITGLTDDATVKITGLSGRLVFETRSLGGTATWNLKDYTGHRARTGIYLVLIVSEDGNEKLAGKLAIIE